MWNRYTNAVNNCVREGTVDKVYPERHSARVTFEDRDDLVSAEIPVLCTYASKNKSYSLPDVGERVVCLCVSNDVTSGSGYIIGSLYSGWKLPRVADQNIAQMYFEDGACFTYNRQTHVFNFKAADGSEMTHNGKSGDLSMNIKGNITITGDKRLNVKIKERIEINGGEDIRITANGNIVEKGSTIRLN